MLKYGLVACSNTTGTMQLNSCSNRDHLTRLWLWPDIFISLKNVFFLWLTKSDCSFSVGEWIYHWTWNADVFVQFSFSSEVHVWMCILAYVHICHLSPGRGIGSVGNAWLAEYSEAGVVRSFELSPAVERQTHSCPYSLEPWSAS